MSDETRNDIVMQLCAQTILFLRKVPTEPPMMVDVLSTALARIISMHPDKAVAMRMANRVAIALPEIVKQYYDLEQPN